MNSPLSNITCYELIADSYVSYRDKSINEFLQAVKTLPFWNFSPAEISHINLVNKYLYAGLIRQINSIFYIFVFCFYRLIVNTKNILYLISIIHNTLSIKSLYRVLIYNHIFGKYTDFNHSKQTKKCKSRNSWRSDWIKTFFSKKSEILPHQIYVSWHVAEGEFQYHIFDIESRGCVGWLGGGCKKYQNLWNTRFSIFILLW